MKAIAYLMFIILILLGCDTGESVLESNQYESLSIHSSILNENRKIIISHPYYKAPNMFFGMKKYPVIYVLDGEEMFEYVAGMVNFLSISKGNDILPQAIIVGIVNNDRNKDLTHDAISGEGNSGQGDQFSKFLNEELFSFIENKYSTVSNRTIIGHSFGGLFALNTLNENPKMFDNYIALDPSYQYVKNKNRDYSTIEYENKKLFIGIANTLQSIESVGKRINLDKSNNHYYELFNFSKRLDSIENKKLQFWHAYYENDTHASLCVDATSDALRKIFPWLQAVISLSPKDELTREEAIKLLSEHTIFLKEQYMEEVKPDEIFVTRLAHFTKDKKLTKELLEFNLANYPDSWNANFTLGNFLKKHGNKETAAFYLEKSLTLQEAPLVRRELNQEVEKR